MRRDGISSRVGNLNVELADTATAGVNFKVSFDLDSVSSWLDTGSSGRNLVGNGWGVSDDNGKGGFLNVQPAKEYGDSMGSGDLGMVLTTLSGVETFRKTF